jgi:hypothetical protein
VHALLICSDDDCPVTFEAYGPLEEVEALACDCGCSLSVIGFPDPVDARRGTLELLPLAA